MANNGLPRFHLTQEDERKLKELDEQQKLKWRSGLHQVLLIVYGFATIFALGYSAALENQGWLETLFIIFVVPLLTVVFFWFCFFGSWQLLERLGFFRFLKWSDHHWPFNSWPFQ